MWLEAFILLDDLRALRWLLHGRNNLDSGRIKRFEPYNDSQWVRRRGRRFLKLPGSVALNAHMKHDWIFLSRRGISNGQTPGKDQGSGLQLTTSISLAH
jgi:hypothetical protein